MPSKFVPRVRKQKAKARLQESKPQTKAPLDSNVAEVIPSEQAKRRAELQEQVRSQHEGQTISGKKRKRLDHYIETKLRKEENTELIKKLAEQKIDTSLLRSSKNLGRGSDTRRETLSRALQESALGLNEEHNANILLERRRPAHKENGREDTSRPEGGPTDHHSTTAGPNGNSRTNDEAEIYPGNENEPEDDSENEDTVATLSVFSDHSTAPKAFGSGLKRPLDLGQDGLPQIKQRKRRKEATVLPDTASDVVDDEHSNLSDSSTSEAWNGFSDGEGSADSEEDEELDTDDQGDVGLESNSEASSDSESTSDEPSDSKKRVFDFKQWAEQQRNQAVGFVPSSNAGITGPQDAAQVRYVPKPFDAVQAPAVGPLSQPEVKAASVVVPRSDEIQDARLKLPVVQEEQRIMEAINNNAITVVCGATGSGKTTQVPQMMFESGYGSEIGETATVPSSKGKTKGLIGVTQPRRVAATSVAARVKVEMGGLGYRVGHQVRFDATVGFKTAIKFMTDGILIREVANDFLLSRYSAIVIDEAHERSVNTDILIGLLSRIVDLRAELSAEKPDKHYPLKLVIMSATMRVQDFTNNPVLFRNGAPPIVQAEGRQFPVVDHFARITQQDYLEEMFRKVSKGHKKLPRGGMLVFLTGQEEIHILKRRLQQALGSSTLRNRQSQPDTDDYVEGLSDEEDAEFDVEDVEEDSSDSASPKRLEENVHILPLYSQLPDNQQSKVFESPPEGSRLIILATNVAETSLTIPGIRYVFDCGRVKQKQYDTQTGVQTFEVGWISKASASQRAGRAGRTGPGHCYRLYSSAVYERDFEEYTVPEILRTSVEGVALMVKGVDFPNVANFPFPTPPDRHALSKAEELLKHLGAIDAGGKITDLGRHISFYPVNPRYGRMLVLAASEGLLAHTIAVVSALAVPEILMSPHQAVLSLSKDEDSEVSENEHEKLRPWKKAQSKLSQWDTHCDAMKLLMAFAICRKPSTFDARCSEYFIRKKGMREAVLLQAQLIRIIEGKQSDTTDLTKLPSLDDTQIAKLKYIIAAGFSDQIAIREDLLADIRQEPGRPPRRTTEVRYRTLLPSTAPHDPKDGPPDKGVFIHPSSVLAELPVSAAPQFVIYSHLSQAATKIIGGRQQRTRMHPLTTISAKQLAALMEGTSLLEVGKPIGNPKLLPYDGKVLRETWVGLSLKGDEVRWPLRERYEQQQKVKGEWVTVKVLSTK